MTAAGAIEVRGGGRRGFMARVPCLPLRVMLEITYAFLTRAGVAVAPLVSLEAFEACTECRASANTARCRAGGAAVPSALRGACSALQERCIAWYMLTAEPPKGTCVPCVLPTHGRGGLAGVRAGSRQTVGRPDFCVDALCRANTEERTFSRELGRDDATCGDTRTWGPLLAACCLWRAV